MSLRLFCIAAAVAAAIPAAPAAAQNASSVAAAKRAGFVGERYDGYLGVVRTIPDQVRRQVAGVNLRRRSLYIGLGTRRNVTAQVAGIATGCELLSRVTVGEYYLLADGVWRRREAGEVVPLPSYCAR